jgi:copper(I)-binding protein
VPPSPAVRAREILIQEPETGESYPEGGVARMAAVLTSDGADSDLLLGVQTPIATETQLYADTTPDDGSYRPTPVPEIAAKPATPIGPSVVPFYVELRHLTTPAREGQTYPVTFRFQKAGSVQAMVPVNIRKGP